MLRNLQHQPNPMPLLYVRGDPPINRSESGSSFWRFGEKDWIGVIDARASDPRVRKRGNAAFRQLEKRIVDLCMKEVVDNSDKILTSLLDEFMDLGGDANILVGRMPLEKHSDKFSEDDIQLKDVYLLTGLLDRGDKKKVKILLEYGADVQLCTDWLVCQDLLSDPSSCCDEDGDRYHVTSYNPLVAMLEDCASYLPHEEDYIVTKTGSFLLTTYAPFVDDLSFLCPFLRRHGSLYHALCWGSDPSLYRECSSQTLFRALDLDLISLHWRWELLVQALTTIETEYIGWFAEHIISRGIDDDNVKIIGSRSHQLRQQLICPQIIMIAAHYEQYELTKKLLLTFRDTVIQNSGNAKLKSCGKILLQRIVDYILCNAGEAEVTFYDFLINQFQANPNATYHFDCDERSKIQQVYENELLLYDEVASNGFVNEHAEQEYLDMITIQLTPDPVNQIKGTSILFDLTGSKGFSKFKYLVEKCGANPLLPKYREIEEANGLLANNHGQSSTGAGSALPDRVIVSSPYHEASSNSMKSIISYYFDKGFIPNVDTCFLGDQTPLMIACGTGYSADTIGYLASKYKADVSIANSNNETAIMIAAKHYHNEAMVKLFKVYGDKIDLDITDKDGKTLQQIVFENGLYRGALRNYFPDSWKQDKADWDSELKRIKRQRT